MVNITLNLSESLLSIFRDIGEPKQEMIRLSAKSGTPILEILEGQGINPLLVPMILIDSETCKKRVAVDTLVDTDVTITLYGPLAGG